MGGCVSLLSCPLPTHPRGNVNHHNLNFQNTSDANFSKEEVQREAIAATDG